MKYRKILVLLCHLVIADVIYGAIWSKRLDLNDGNHLVKLPVGHPEHADKFSRTKRDTSSGDDSKLSVHYTTLKDKDHNEAIVHWSGEGSNVRKFCRC